jgi:hypothetical protein
MSEEEGKAKQRRRTLSLYHYALVDDLRFDSVNEKAP